MLQCVIYVTIDKVPIDLFLPARFIVSGACMHKIIVSRLAALSVTRDYLTIIIKTKKIFIATFTSMPNLIDYFQFVIKQLSYS